MTKKSPIAVLLLPFVTFGIYTLVWIVKAKGELVDKGADIPTSWLLVIPFANIYYLWKWGQGAAMVVSKKSFSSVEAFLMMLFLGPIGCAIIQSKFNKIV